jgi:hypothetical protein
MLLRRPILETRRHLGSNCGPKTEDAFRVGQTEGRFAGSGHGGDAHHAGGDPLAGAPDFPARGAVYPLSVGLAVFLQGVKIGLLPMGETIGAELPQKAPLPIILLVAFTLGFAVTVAEPGVRVLAYQVELVSAGEVSRIVLIIAVALAACRRIAAPPHLHE